MGWWGTGVHGGTGSGDWVSAAGEEWQRLAGKVHENAGGRMWVGGKLDRTSVWNVTEALVLTLLTMLWKSLHFHCFIFWLRSESIKLQLLIIIYVCRILKCPTFRCNSLQSLSRLLLCKHHWLWLFLTQVTFICQDKVQASMELEWIGSILMQTAALPTCTRMHCEFLQFDHFLFTRIYFVTFKLTPTTSQNINTFFLVSISCIMVFIAQSPCLLVTKITWKHVTTVFSKRIHHLWSITKHKNCRINRGWKRRWEMLIGMCAGTCPGKNLLSSAPARWKFLHSVYSFKRCNKQP